MDKADALLERMNKELDKVDWSDTDLAIAHSRAIEKAWIPRILGALRAVGSDWPTGRDILERYGR